MARRFRREKNDEDTIPSWLLKHKWLTFLKFMRTIQTMIFLCPGLYAFT